MSPRPSPPIWAAVGTCCSNLNALVHNLDGVGAEEVAHFLGHLNLRGAQALASAGIKGSRVNAYCMFVATPTRGYRTFRSNLGTQHANRSSEMYHDWERKMQTIQQKWSILGSTNCKPFIRNASCLRTQNANRSTEMHHVWEHKMQAVQQKCIVLGNTRCKPFIRNAEPWGSHRAYQKHRCGMITTSPLDEV